MASRADDHRPAEGNARPIFDVAEQLEISGLSRGRVERVGPCPECGGRDRFGLNAVKNVFNCRRCGGTGGSLDLVMFVRHCSFPEALDWLCGPSRELTEAERAERRRRDDANRRKREEDASRYRESAIAEARAVWRDAIPAEGTPARDYLTRRGIRPEQFPVLPKCLMFQPEARYMIPDGQRGFREIHRGPALVAAVQGRDDRLIAVHRTWIDLDQPKGKLAIADPAKPEQMLPAKKIRGAKKGGAIRLRTPHDATALVMAEGIETTLSALVADAIPGAAYWCGVDLGNLAGQRMMGNGQRYAGIPDLEDREAFVPPPWVRHLVLVQDGDSDPKSTRAKLLSGARRAMWARPGLRAQIVHAGAGVDMNDVLMGTGE